MSLKQERSPLSPPKPIAHWPESKLLFRILLQGHTPEAFNAYWQKQLERHYPSVAFFAASFPRIHLLNDLVGVVEVFWDGGIRILGDFYFRAQGQRKFGKLLTSRTQKPLNSRHFYMLYHAMEIGGAPSFSSADECRQALSDALLRVETEATRLGCYADTSTERNLVQYLDVMALFGRNEIQDEHSPAR